MIGKINRKISDIAVLTNVLPQAQPPNHQALEPDRDPHPIVVTTGDWFNFGYRLGNK